MRYSAEQSLTEIRRRETALRSRRERRGTWFLSGGTAMLLAALVICFADIRRAAPGIARASGPGYGSILLAEDAGGYVLAGVIAFMAGVIVTVLCIRYRKKPTEKGKKDGPKNL